MFYVLSKKSPLIGCVSTEKFCLFLYVYFMCHSHILLKCVENLFILLLVLGISESIQKFFCTLYFIRKTKLDHPDLEVIIKEQSEFFSQATANERTLMRKNIKQKTREVA